MKKARPRESTTYIANPHKGMATFQRFNGDPLNEGVAWSESGPMVFPKTDRDVADGYLPCTIAYCRWYWRQFQPARTKIDWAFVEQALTTARARGQTLQVRLMPQGSHHCPPPDWYMERYDTRVVSNKQKPYKAAVFGT